MPIRRVWTSVDRWGPLLVTCLMLIILIGVLWTYGEKIARIEGEQKAEIRRFDDFHETYQTDISRRDQEIELYKAYVNVLRVEMVRSGIDVPELEEIDPNRNHVKNR